MGWKDLSEMAPLLSEAEVHFEKKKRFVGLFLGPLLFALAFLSSPWESVSPVGMTTLGVFLWTVAWWVCEPIPIPATAFLSMALLVFFGVLTVEAGFAAWANWINIFLLGACVIGHAMSVHGLTRRIAYHMVCSPLVKRNPWRLLLLFGIGAAVLSSVLSHVVTTMIFISIALGLMETLQVPRNSRYGEAVFISIAWGSNLGIVTPVGTPPNLIVIGMIQTLHYRVGFAQWIIACLPVFVMALVAMFLVIRYVLRPEMPQWQVSSAFLQGELTKLGPLSRGEKIAAGAFLTAMFLWVLPDLAPLFLEGGKQHPVSVWITKRLDWSVSAILVATSLFLIPVDWKNRKFAMTWDEAMKGVEWGTLSLIAAALTLGSAIASKTVGLGAFIENSISSFAASGASQFFFVLGTVAFTVVVGSFISNIAIVGMVGAIVLAVAPSAGINPVALLVAVGMAASMDFALPIGTPPSAMVFASGYVRLASMVKGGVIMSLLAIVVVSFFGFYLAQWVFPWPG